MSKELNSIKGKTEYVKDFHTKEVDHENNMLHITSFYGGEDRGSCLQLSIDENHIQLDKENVTKLIKELVNWI